jgi:hypothetical protein
MPDVTVADNPSGAPIAATGSPTFTVADEPSAIIFSSWEVWTLSTARSLCGPGRRSSRPPGCQLHCELVASVKLLTELTTLAASLVTVAICAAEGLDDRPSTELFSASTDEVMALVWLGKSLLAELTSAVASLWIPATCDFKPLTPLLRFKLVSPLTEFSRLVRFAQ